MALEEEGMAKRKVTLSMGEETTYPKILWKILDGLNMKSLFYVKKRDVVYLETQELSFTRMTAAALNTVSAYLNEAWAVDYKDDQDAVRSTRRLAFTPQILEQSLFVIADGNKEMVIPSFFKEFITDDLPALFTDVFRPPPADQGSNNDDDEEEPSGGPSGQ